MRLCEALVDFMRLRGNLVVLERKGCVDRFVFSVS